MTTSQTSWRIFSVLALLVCFIFRQASVINRYSIRMWDKVNNGKVYQACSHTFFAADYNLVGHLFFLIQFKEFVYHFSSIFLRLYHLWFMIKHIGCKVNRIFCDFSSFKSCPGSSVNKQRLFAEMHVCDIIKILDLLYV